MDLSIGDLRINYTQGGLIESEAHSNPFVLFQQWFATAVNADILEPNAMTLATVGPDGKPHARIVLLKDFDERGFVLFTNYNSQKGQQLQVNPWASLVLWWPPLERQVRIEGSVEKITSEESDRYFNSRPWSSRLGAWASDQTQPIPDRAILEERLERLKMEYEGKEVPRPPHWGGFRVIANSIEFWQGRPNRLHDRLCYRLLPSGSWCRERLSP
ncbi:MAG: Pyridoxine/pyridoxamine 5'-phosphate oxidase [Chroococcopsis gigantea SAG 12.99]|jgi:pyridoxamine 5'-phosphate oxidase|nr:pyridoxamine 5'-phosphate oxidase [Chlorogloea purpurea SAG 13.99]MDV3001637.1 Pyridoxine/pyridoxamine 5'-phosphate oxidase [Chroococcopsis gigantea SAG 12.99]